jgi:hypothetical protein
MFQDTRVLLAYRDKYGSLFDTTRRLSSSVWFFPAHENPYLHCLIVPLNIEPLARKIVSSMCSLEHVLVVLLVWVEPPLSGRWSHRPNVGWTCYLEDCLIVPMWAGPATWKMASLSQCGLDLLPGRWSRRPNVG